MSGGKDRRGTRLKHCECAAVHGLAREAGLGELGHGCAPWSSEWQESYLIPHPSCALYYRALISGSFAVAHGLARR